MTAPVTVPDGLWNDVLGQPLVVSHLRRAAENPVHAYLFVGPPGSTKDEAARAFAAALLHDDAHRVASGDDRRVRLALAGVHPDVHEVVRTGPAISAEQAREIVRLAALAPVEGDRKVIILHELHLLRPEGAALLLKTIEEPPASTFFIVLADFIPTELITVASRCVRIEFCAVPDDVVVGRLVAEHADAAVAAAAAAASGGDLTRARILVGDPALAARRQAFATVPNRLDGTGSAVVRVGAELLELIDEAAAPLAARHRVEVADLDARTEHFGERGGGRKLLEERHRRELRRHRSDELRSGLAVLAGTYRDLLVAGTSQRPEASIAAVKRIHDAIEALERNPNEPLLMQSLLWSLPVAPAR